MNGHIGIFPPVGGRGVLMGLVRGVIHVMIEGTHCDGRGRRGGRVTLKETLASLLFLLNLNAVADKVVLEESRIMENGAAIEGVRSFANEAWLTSTGGRVAVDSMDGSVIEVDVVHIGIHGDSKQRQRRQPVGSHIVGRRWGSSGSIGRGGNVAAGVGRSGMGRGWSREAVNSMDRGSSRRRRTTWRRGESRRTALVGGGGWTGTRRGISAVLGKNKWAIWEEEVLLQSGENLARRELVG
jgi:hypothetical protein